MYTHKGKENQGKILHPPLQSSLCAAPNLSESTEKNPKDLGSSNLGVKCDIRKVSKIIAAVRGKNQEMMIQLCALEYVISIREFHHLLTLNVRWLCISNVNKLESRKIGRNMRLT